MTEDLTEAMRDKIDEWAAEASCEHDMDGSVARALIPVVALYTQQRIADALERIATVMEGPRPSPFAAELVIGAPVAKEPTPDQPRRALEGFEP